MTELINNTKVRTPFEQFQLETYGNINPVFMPHPISLFEEAQLIEWMQQKHEEQLLTIH